MNSPKAIIESEEKVDEDEKQDDLIACLACDALKDFSEITFLESCDHSFCKSCLMKYIAKSLMEHKDAACFTCNSRIPEYQKKVL